MGKLIVFSAIFVLIIALLTGGGILINTSNVNVTSVQCYSTINGIQVLQGLSNGQNYTCNLPTDMRNQWPSCIDSMTYSDNLNSDYDNCQTWYWSNPQFGVGLFFVALGGVGLVAVIIVAITMIIMDHNEDRKNCEIKLYVDKTVTVTAERPNEDA